VPIWLIVAAAWLAVLACICVALERARRGLNGHIPPPATWRSTKFAPARLHLTDIETDSQFAKMTGIVTPAAPDPTRRDRLDGAR